MDTPICDFVKKYNEGSPIRLHMPGHKGKNFLGGENLDITEIDGADVLYSSEGIIRASERNAEKLFGTARTVYSAEGSSLCIRAMLYLLRLYVGKKPLVFAGRNAHKSFLTSVALVDVDINWLSQDGSLLSCNITPDVLENAFKDSELPSAVYVTSPDYLGNTVDIKGLSEVCHKHGVLLLVDNAHGAYLNFLPENLHPIYLGADMCCDSAHKTLPVLTGGAYLHIAKGCDFFVENAERAMAVFASTSPSYLILQSLDSANRYLADGYKEKLSDCIAHVERLKTGLRKNGYELTGNEQLKITIMPKKYGYRGIELADILRSNGVVCEFSDKDFLVMMFTPETEINAFDKIERIFAELPRKEEINEVFPALKRGKRILSVREALFSQRETVSVKEALGRVSADVAVSCPPAVPIVVCGEEISENTLSLFDYYGIEHCSVIRH